MNYYGVETTKGLVLIQAQGHDIFDRRTTFYNMRGDSKEQTISFYHSNLVSIEPISRNEYDNLRQTVRRSSF